MKKYFYIFLFLFIYLNTGFFIVEKIMETEYLNNTTNETTWINPLKLFPIHSSEKEIYYYYDINEFVKKQWEEYPIKFLFAIFVWPLAIVVISLWQWAWIVALAIAGFLISAFKFIFLGGLIQFLIENKILSFGVIVLVISRFFTYLIKKYDLFTWILSVIRYLYCACFFI